MLDLVGLARIIQLQCIKMSLAPDLHLDLLLLIGFRGDGEFLDAGGWYARLVRARSIQVYMYCEIGVVKRMARNGYKRYREVGTEKV